MADSLGDILSGSRFEEPAEVQIIKKFVRDTYKQSVQVTMRPNQIVIQVKGAALAGALRTSLHELQELCGTNSRLIIRIRGAK